MPARSLVTLHAPIAKATSDKILHSAIEEMERFGFRWWIEMKWDTPPKNERRKVTRTPLLVMMVDVPEEWLSRGPTQKELDHFNELWEKGEHEAAQKFAAEGGLPHWLRD